MRRWLLWVSLCHLVVAAQASGEERHQEVTVEDPYIELHTGPGRGYPIFYVAERGAEIALLKRRTEWFKVFVPRGESGEEGWVHRDQLQGTLGANGEPFDAPGFTLTDFSERRWEVGASYGDFGGANMISTFGAYSMTPNLSFELSVSQALGRFSDSQMVNIDLLHTMFPERRASPYFTLGGGSIHTEPKATLIATVDRTDTIAHAGVGARTYLTRRFVLRVEYKTYVVFTSRDDNEEIREWKAGFSFFF